MTTIGCEMELLQNVYEMELIQLGMRWNDYNWIYEME